MENSNDPFEKDDKKVSETDEEIIDLMDEALFSGDDDEIIQLSEIVDSPEPKSDEIIMGITEPVQQEEADEEEIFDLTDTVEETVGLTEEKEDLEDDSDKSTSLSIPISKLSDDQEILDLIDDIQSTLDEKEGTGEEVGIDSLADEQDEEPEPFFADENEEAKSTIILGDDEPLETIVQSESESEFESELVDSLGIDLTSELNRDILSDEDDTKALAEEAEDGGEPTEVVETGTSFETAGAPLERAVERAVEKVLAEKLESALGKIVEEVLTREIEKIRKDFLS